MARSLNLDLCQDLQLYGEKSKSKSLPGFCGLTAKSLNLIQCVIFCWDVEGQRNLNLDLNLSRDIAGRGRREVDFSRSNH